MDAVQTGRALGSRYQLLERLGSGAMGEVWSALDRTAGTEVAAKLLRGEHVHDPQVVARFIQERSILLGLQHPAIVRVRDLVVEGDDLAIVMDLVQGSDLRRRLREEGTLPPAEAVSLTIALMQALAYAHQQSCLHRDVKPDNVLIDADGRPLLSDFGIARLAQETTVRVTGALGTPEYMAPEVFVAEQVSAAADVYGAGVLLYELLAGRTPFSGGSNGYVVVNRHVTCRPPAVEGLPPRLEAVLQSLLAKEPARRLSAEGAAQALSEVLPSLAGLPRLPVQQAPDTWEQVAAGGPTGVVSGTQPATLDPGATTVRGLVKEAPDQGPVTGEVAPLSPLVGGALSPDETSLGVVRRDHVAPTLAPAVSPAEPERRRRRQVLVAVLSLVGLAAAAGLVLLLVGGSGSSAKKDQTAAVDLTADRTDEPLPTGLTVARSASLDAGAGRLDVRITYTAGRTPLAGPFYEDVPAASCEVAWGDGASTVPDRTPGITSPCGFKVGVGRLGARASTTVDYSVAFSAGSGDAKGALDAFLQQASERTTKDLTGLAQSAAYPVQRLTGIAVDVPGTVFSQQRLAVRLLPLWLGTSDADNLDLLFDSTAVGGASQLLQQVAGGLPGVQLTPRDCGDALGVQGPTALFTSHPASGCTISARVGELEDASSSAFDIGYHSG